MQKGVTKKHYQKKLYDRGVTGANLRSIAASIVHYDKMRALRADMSRS